MKKPERMKNKTTKAFLYQNLYPVNLYVTTLDDWEDACDFFDFFLTTKELRNDEPERDRPKLSSVMGATFLVREKYSRYAYLVTWCVEQLEDFIECKRKEKRMIRKMTKQDGN